MNRLLPLALAGGLALLAPAAHARTAVVTSANNEKSVALTKGDTLLVVLDANGAAGYTWHVVYDPNGPLLLSSKHIYPGSFGNKGIGSEQRRTALHCLTERRFWACWLPQPFADAE